MQNEKNHKLTTSLKYQLSKRLSKLDTLRGLHKIIGKLCLFGAPVDDLYSAWSFIFFLLRTEKEMSVKNTILMIMVDTKITKMIVNLIIALVERIT